MGSWLSAWRASLLNNGEECVTSNIIYPGAEHSKSAQ